MSSESVEPSQQVADLKKNQSQKGEKKPPKHPQQQKKGQQHNADENDKSGQKKGNAKSGEINAAKMANPPAIKQQGGNAPAARQGGGGGGAVRTPRPPRLALFDHLSKPRTIPKSTTIEGLASIHPAIIKLGELFLAETIYDDDDRAQALLIAFCNVVEDYKTPPHTSLSWDLDKHIKLQVQHLVSHSRAHSMAMGNIIKYLRFVISQIPPDESEADAKSRLVEKLNLFLEERIIFAQDSICANCAEIIRDKDVIVTYGSSPLVRALLLRARETKTFRVIVIDSMPRWDGLHTLRSLVGSDEDDGEDENSSCVYTSMAGAAAAMKEATRVILGASALLSNGTLLAPAGTGMIACLASHRRVPVIVASESYKFSDKVQMDSIVYNELADPFALMSPQPPLVNAGDKVDAPSLPSGQQGAGPTQSAALYYPRSRWPVGVPPPPSAPSDVPPLPPPYDLLHLRYDLTPVRNISAVVTEVGIIPPTSVPVLIRELRYEGASN